jgi:hypothetical protein
MRLAKDARKAPGAMSVRIIQNWYPQTLHAVRMNLA